MELQEIQVMVEQVVVEEQVTLETLVTEEVVGVEEDRCLHQQGGNQDNQLL